MSPNITALVFLIASAGAVFGFINPQYAKYQILAKDKAQYDTAYSQARDVRTAREKLIASASNISNTEKSRLSKVLPDTVDTVRLTMDMNGIASKYGITIKKIDVKVEDKKANAAYVAPSPFVTAAKAEDFRALPLSFSVTASYENFNKFLLDLEKSLRIIDITSISIAPGFTGLYDFAVSARMYSFSPVAAVPTADTATSASTAKVVPDLKGKAVDMLSRLSALKLDRALFDSELFKTLQDFGIEVVQEPKGRTNPFAPIGQ